MRYVSTCNKITDAVNWAFMILIAIAIAPTNLAAQTSEESASTGSVVKAVINDDLNVEGSVCQSDDSSCVDGTETFTSPGGLVSEAKFKDGAPGVWFEDTNGRDWEVLSSYPTNDDIFKIRSTETGEPTRTPFAITPNAPNNSMYISDNGVGIGTTTPQSTLDVTSSSTSLVRVINTTGTVASRAMMFLGNNGAPAIQMRDNSDGTFWNFRTGSGGRFVIDAPGNNPQMTVFDTGNMVIRGTLTEGSSRTYKHNIEPVNELDILAKVAALDVSEWSYTVNDNLKSAGNTDKVRHIGPMAEDFREAFGLGATSKGIASLDSAGVALAAIKGLNNLLTDKETRIQNQESTIQQLVSENAALAERMTRLEEMLLRNKGRTQDVSFNY